MTHEELVASNHAKLLKELRGLGGALNFDDAHRDADRCLCSMLRCLGYDDLVFAWHFVPKRYASNTVPEK